jgi:nitroreductase/NAD-dependent dihydropyrimidine dehydrogenase PreA subunit
MAMITIDRTRCKKDGICAAECPFSLISLTDEDGFPEMRPAAAKLCIQCGHCVAVCPHDALSLAAMSRDDFQPLGYGSLPTLKKTGQLLASRRSIRSYQQQPILRPHIEQLLDICRWAPSAKNAQPVHWLVLENPETVRQLAGLVVDWLRTGTSYPGIVAAWDQGKDMVLRNAPHLLVAHAREDSLKPEIDCTIALTYFDLAANSGGIGTCWAGILMSAAAAGYAPLLDALALPEGHRLYGAMVFGYPRFPYFKIPARKEAQVTWRS